MYGTAVNPLAIRKGDKIATASRINNDGTITVVKSHEVKRAEPCGRHPFHTHIDADCYDSRFATVILVGA